MQNSPAIIWLNPMNFDKVMENPVVLIDFWGHWCQPCKAQDPILDEVARLMEGRAVIAKMDVNDNRFLSQKLGVRNIPTIIIYHHGKEVERMNGIHSLEMVLNKLEKYINN